MKRLLASLLVLVMLGGCAPGDGLDGPMPAVHPPSAAPVREALWILDAYGSLRAYDGRTDRVATRVEIGATGGSWGIYGGGPVVWAVGDGIVRVDTAGARVTARGPRPPTVDTVVYALGALWIRGGTELWRVGDDAVPVKVALPAGTALAEVVEGTTGLWLTATDGRLFRLDPSGAAVTPLGSVPEHIALGEGAEGLIALGRDTVTVLDPATGATRWSLPLPPSDSTSLFDGLVAGSPHSWVLTYDSAFLLRPEGLTWVPLGEVMISYRPATGFGSLWIGDDGAGQLVRIPEGDPTAVRRLPLPPNGEFADLVLQVFAGRQGVWVVDADSGVGVTYVTPDSNRRRRVVKPENSGLTEQAVVAGPPTHGLTA